jgi:hypothetical protein
VTTEAAAIAKGKRACAEEMSSRRMPVKFEMPKQWHARDEGDHWHVWGNGDGGEDSWPTIDVPKSGQRVTGYNDCKFIITTD